MAWEHIQEPYDRLIADKTVVRYRHETVGVGHAIETGSSRSLCNLQIAKNHRERWPGTGRSAGSAPHRQATIDGKQLGLRPGGRAW